MAVLRFHVPVATLTEPRTGECLVDYWWLVHPELGALFTCDSSHGSLSREARPMANMDRRLAEHRGVVGPLLDRGYEPVHLRVAYMIHAMQPMKEVVEAYQAERKKAFSY